MKQDYSSLPSISADEFKKQIATCFAKSQSTKSDAEDLKKIEQFLDLRDGLLKNEEFYVSKAECPKCSRRLTFFDHVYTSVKDAGHSKSFVVHTLLGAKYFIQPPRAVRCSACDTAGAVTLNYESPRYGCCRA